MSISSQFMSYITTCRNPRRRKLFVVKPNPLNVAVAEVLYILTIPFAIVETALSTIAKIFSFFLPIGQKNHTKMTEWVKSSAFSIVWAFGDALLNPICVYLIPTERIARTCAASGNFFIVPENV